MMAQPTVLDVLEPFCQGISDSVIALDRDARICLFNPAAEAVFGLHYSDVIGHPLADYPALQPLAPLFEQAASGAEAAVPEALPYQVRIIPLPGIGPAMILSPSSANGKLSMLNVMSRVVHDLKTPISSAKKFIEMVEYTGDLSDKQANFVQRAQNSLDKMLTMVQNLLDMARLESGAPFKPTVVDLNDLVRRSASTFENLALQNNIQLKLDLGPACFVQGDARQLESAIGNLISNAIKYSPAGGEVSISVALENRSATIRVEDQGLGIAPEHLERIFEQFYRVPLKEAWRIEGSGLGLSIARAIVEKHGSIIQVESTPGHGSVFTFALPLIESPS
jgi:signal transduction histidine kinase